MSRPVSRPGPRPRPPRAGRPLGLLGAVGLGLLFEVWLTRHAADLTPAGVAGFRFSAEKAAREATDAPILCFGDSLVKHGVAPRVLEAKLGRRAYNLAAGGALAPLTYTLFKRSLDAGARPSLVVVDFKATQLSIDPRIQERSLAEVFTARECLDFARDTQDAGTLGRLLAMRALPSYRTRLELRAWLYSALAGKPATPREEVLTWERNWRVNLGAGLLPTTVKQGKTRDELMFDMIGVCFPVPGNATYVKRFLDLADAREIPVVWLVPPIAPEVQARRDRHGYDAFFDKLLGKVVEHYPNLTVVDGRKAGYEPGRFVDVSHLDAEGAAVLSEDLADVLRDRLDTPPTGPRRVALAPYRPRPLAYPLEDERQSAVARAKGLPEPAQAPVARAAPGAGTVVR